MEWVVVCAPYLFWFVCVCVVWMGGGGGGVCVVLTFFQNRGVEVEVEDGSCGDAFDRWMHVGTRAPTWYCWQPLSATAGKPGGARELRVISSAHLCVKLPSLPWSLTRQYKTAKAVGRGKTESGLTGV